MKKGYSACSSDSPSSSSSSATSCNEDRIRNLPDPLIHHILSFIYTKYAVQTCVLSTRWPYIWTSLAVLKFCDSVHRETWNEEECRTTKRFIKFVTDVLSRRDNSDMQRFSLECSLNYSTTDRLYKCINRCIATAVSHNVQELYIQVTPEWCFEIPVCLCTCESLKKLELDVRAAGMDLKLSLPELKYFEFISAEDSYRGLVKGSNSEVTLNAPSLSSFILDSYMSTSFTLENLSSLVTADSEINIYREDEYYDEIQEDVKELDAQRFVGFFRGVHKVKVLTLRRSFMLLELLIYLDSQQLVFYNLQRLELWTNFSKDCLHSILYILKMSPNIESVSLKISQPYYDEQNPHFIEKRKEYPYCDEVKFNTENIGDYWDTGFSLRCMICHLKFVKIKGLLGCVDELKFLEILFKHAAVLEKVVLASDSSKQDSLRKKRMKKFSEMLLTFPRASKNIIILCRF